MNAWLRVDGQPKEMNPFVEAFVANVCRAMLTSLKGTESAHRALFKIDGKKLDLVINGMPLDLHLDKGFAMVVTRDTLLGMFAHFRGLRGWREIEVEVAL
jgi:hypothetical protein